MTMKILRKSEFYHHNGHRQNKDLNKRAEDLKIRIEKREASLEAARGTIGAVALTSRMARIRELKAELESIRHLS